MIVCETIDQIRSFVHRQHNEGHRLGFVPTMGALHDGHRALLQAARRAHDAVVLSVFVNPIQFGPDEDYERYPRTYEQDLAIARALDVDAVFVPSVAEMYPRPLDVRLTVGELAAPLCGRSRQR
jgi:pantoate--beta-alanine ligase